jgi:hypothetical protein
MKQINQSIYDVAASIREEYFNSVNNSTGSLHDKTDIKNLIIKILDEMQTQLIAEIEVYNISTPTNSDVKLYTKEMIEEAWSKVDYDNYVSVDCESAEFELNYRNTIELNSADVEVDYDGITDAFDTALDKAYEETYSINNTNN